MTASQSPVTSYILSLVGGLIVLLGSLLNLVWFGLYGSNWGGYGGWMGGMMGGYYNYMGGYGGSYGLTAVITLVGLISGVLMIVGAVMLKAKPQEHIMWGTVILIFSVISFVGMGGFFLGAVLGIIGGAFAVSYRPRTS